MLSIRRFPEGAKNQGLLLGQAEMPNGEKWTCIYIQQDKSAEINTNGLITKKESGITAKVITLPADVMVNFFVEYLSLTRKGNQWFKDGIEVTSIEGLTFNHGCLYKGYSLKPFKKDQLSCRIPDTGERILTHKKSRKLLRESAIEKEDLPNWAEYYVDVFFCGENTHRDMWVEKDAAGKWVEEDLTKQQEITAIDMMSLVNQEM